MAYCRRCGVLLIEDAVFCQHCGSPVDAEIKPAETNNIYSVPSDNQETAFNSAPSYSQDSFSTSAPSYAQDGLFSAQAPTYNAEPVQVETPLFSQNYTAPTPDVNSDDLVSAASFSFSSPQDSTPADTFSTDNSDNNSFMSWENNNRSSFDSSNYSFSNKTNDSYFSSDFSSHGANQDDGGSWFGTSAESSQDSFTPTYEPAGSVNQGGYTPTYEPVGSVNQGGYTPSYEPAGSVNQGGYTPSYEPAGSGNQGGYTPSYGPGGNTNQGGYTPSYGPAGSVASVANAPAQGKSAGKNKKEKAPREKPEKSKKVKNAGKQEKSTPEGKGNFSAGNMSAAYDQAYGTVTYSKNGYDPSRYYSNADYMSGNKKNGAKKAGAVLLVIAAIVAVAVLCVYLGLFSGPSAVLKKAARTVNKRGTSVSSYEALFLNCYEGDNFATYFEDLYSADGESFKTVIKDELNSDLYGKYKSQYGDDFTMTVEVIYETDIFEGSKEFSNIQSEWDKFVANTKETADMYLGMDRYNDLVNHQNKAYAKYSRYSVKKAKNVEFNVVIEGRNGTTTIPLTYTFAKVNGKWISVYDDFLSVK